MTRFGVARHVLLLALAASAIAACPSNRQGAGFVLPPADAGDAGGSPDAGILDGGLDGGGGDCRLVNCGSSCCESSQYCNRLTGQCENSCTPACAGLECGPDGCNGSCGSCPGAQTCSPTGQCQCVSQNSTCDEDSDCCPGLSCVGGICAGACGSAGASCETAACCTGVVCSVLTAQCCAAANDVCTVDGDCCSGVCNSGLCACSPSNATCGTDGDCCAGTCSGGVCAVAACVASGAACTGVIACCSPNTCTTIDTEAICCLQNGDGCTTSDTCCTGACINDVCSPSCVEVGESCASQPCCNDMTCSSNSQTCCLPLAGLCTSDGDCCSGNCIDDSCECSISGGTCTSDADCCSGLSCTSNQCQTQATGLWSAVTSPNTEVTWYGMTVLGTGEAWAAGNDNVSSGAIAHYTPASGAWSLETIPSGALPNDVGAVSSSSGVVTALSVGSAGQLLTGPVNWTETTLTGTPFLAAIAVISATDAWAVGSADTISGGAVAFHYDGTSWTENITGLAATDSFFQCWGFGSNAVWMVGETAAGAGSVQEWNGATWASAGDSPPLEGEGVGGASTSDVWVATGNYGETGGGRLDHWNGTTWDVMTTTAEPMLSVWAGASDDVWAVGSAGTILHWNGSTWTAEASGTTADLWTVRGDVSVVWAAGSSGTILMRQRD